LLTQLSCFKVLY